MFRLIFLHMLLQYFFSEGLIWKILTCDKRLRWEFHIVLFSPESG